MARWKRSLWTVGLGVVFSTSAMGEARDRNADAAKDEATPASAPSPNEQKGDFLARVQVYSDLVREMGRLATDRSASAPVKDFAARMSRDHLDNNGRLADYVLTRRVDLPDAQLAGEERSRVQAAMGMIRQLQALRGAQFDRAFLIAAQQLPALAARELMAGRDRFRDDAELVRVFEPLIGQLDQHRKDAEGLERELMPAAARRPPSQR